MREDDFIVSKTDLKGRISYANRIFMEFAGYTEQELLGIQHNVIRHRDMPRSVFKMMWETLQNGQEFFGYIKNMAKDGSYYWTFANVTPILTQSEAIVGYYSVRRKPNTDAVRHMQQIYTDMLAAEQQSKAADAIQVSRALMEKQYSGELNGYEKFILSL